MSVFRFALDSPVIQSFAVVAVGVAVVVFATWLAKRWIHRPLWRRMLWRATLVASAAWMLAEVSGGNSLVARWMRAPTESAKQAVDDERPSAAVERLELLPASAPVHIDPLPPGDDTSEELLESPGYEEVELVFELATQAAFYEAQPRERDSFSPLDPEVQNTVTAKKNPDPVRYGTPILFASLAGSAALALRFIGRRVVVLWFTWRHTSAAPQEIVELVGRLIAPREGRSSRGAISLHCVESLRLTAPVVYGVWRPTLALPVGFAKSLPPDQFQAVLAHELVHVSGRDPLWQVAFDALVTLVWWHPCGWLARAAHKSACEAAADAGAATTEGGSRALASALVRLARQTTAGPHLGWAALETGGRRRSRLGRRVLRLLREDSAAMPIAVSPGKRLFATAMVGLLVTILLFGAALARCSVSDRTYDLGENPMTIWQSSWRSSLAAAAVAAMLGTAYAEEVEETEDVFEGELALELAVDVGEHEVEVEDALELLVELQPEARAELVLASDDEAQAEAERIEELENVQVRELVLLEEHAKAKQLDQAHAEHREARIAQELAIAKKRLAEAQAQLAREREQLEVQIKQLVTKAEREAADGRVDTAKQIMEQVRRIQQVQPSDRVRVVQRTRTTGEPHVEFASGAERRVHHLIQAAENLRAIGKNELAEELMEEARSAIHGGLRRDDEIRRQTEEQREKESRQASGEESEARRVEVEIHRMEGAESGARGMNAAGRRMLALRERDGAVDELREEMNELKSQMHKMQEMLENVVGRLDDDGQVERR